MTAAYLLFLAAGCFPVFGAAFTRAITFPLRLSRVVVDCRCLRRCWRQRNCFSNKRRSHGTARRSERTAGMSVFRVTYGSEPAGLLTGHGERDAGGIHSTMVLVITRRCSPRHLFLRSGWKRLFARRFWFFRWLLRGIGFGSFFISEFISTNQSRYD